MWAETETSRDAWWFLIQTIQRMAVKMRGVAGTPQSALSPANLDAKLDKT